jgi:hypothetical protein
LFCVLVMGAILVPALRAQRNATPVRRAADVRTLAQQKINPRVMDGDLPPPGRRQGQGGRDQLRRHCRRSSWPRAGGRAGTGAPRAGKKFRALGGVVVSTSSTYDSLVGWMPLQTLERLAADPTVRAIEPGQP